MKRQFDAAVEARRDHLERLRRGVDAATAEYQKAVRENETAGNSEPSAVVLACVETLLARQAEFHEAVSEQSFLGLSDEVLDDIERTRRDPRDQRYSRADVETAPTTGDLEEVVPESLRQVRAMVDPEWLDREARKGYQLSDEFLTGPLHITGSIRFDRRERAQRFARMLLVAKDFLRKHDRLDFFKAPMFVVEVASLGAALPQIYELGAKAREKLQRLPTMTDD